MAWWSIEPRSAFAARWVFVKDPAKRSRRSPPSVAHQNIHSHAGEGGDTCDARPAAGIHQRKTIATDHHSILLSTAGVPAEQLVNGAQIKFAHAGWHLWCTAPRRSS
jgi:hypothetical protein